MDWREIDARIGVEREDARAGELVEGREAAGEERREETTAPGEAARRAGDATGDDGEGLRGLGTGEDGGTPGFTTATRMVEDIAVRVLDARGLPSAGVRARLSLMLPS